MFQDGVGVVKFIIKPVEEVVSGSRHDLCQGLIQRSFENYVLRKVRFNVIEVLLEAESSG